MLMLTPGTDDFPAYMLDPVVVPPAGGGRLLRRKLAGFGFVSNSLSHRAEHLYLVGSVKG